jgi:hypothetical protein
MYSLARVLLLVVLAGGLALLIVAASRQPYFPSDLAIARAVQSLVPMPVGMATWITASADKPRYFLLFTLTAIIAWVIARWRAALLVIPILFGSLLFGIWRSSHVAQPRPSPELIKVIRHPKGYVFSSIFGLVYAATFDKEN